MRPKFTKSFIVILRYFTCRPNHDMGPIFYLRTDARPTCNFYQSWNWRPLGLKSTTLTTGSREQTLWHIVIFYECQVWRYNEKYLDRLYTAREKTIRRVWKISYRTHTNLVNLINKSCYINYVLERKEYYIWMDPNKQSKSVVSSNCQLFNDTIC